jgi:hypothetical protein
VNVQDTLWRPVDAQDVPVKGEVIVIPIIKGERGHTKGGGDNHGENNENEKNHAER